MKETIEEGIASHLSSLQAGNSNSAACGHRRGDLSFGDIKALLGVRQTTAASGDSDAGAVEVIGDGERDDDDDPNLPSDTLSGLFWSQLVAFRNQPCTRQSTLVALTTRTFIVSRVLFCYSANSFFFRLFAFRVLAQRAAGLSGVGQGRPVWPVGACARGQRAPRAEPCVVHAGRGANRRVPSPGHCAARRGARSHHDGQRLRAANSFLYVVICHLKYFLFILSIPYTAHYKSMVITHERE